MPRDSEVAKTDRQLAEETAQRARRIETRVTQIAEHLGVEHGGAKPYFNAAAGRIIVPTSKVSVDDINAAVPVAARQILVSIDVYCGETYLLSVSWET